MKTLKAARRTILDLMFSALHGSMGNHILKTTIEIADDLFECAQKAAREQKTTFRALTEQGLRLVLAEKRARAGKWKWKPSVVDGAGLTAEFREAGWDKIRAEIYKGRGT